MNKLMTALNVLLVAFVAQATVIAAVQPKAENVEPKQSKSWWGSKPADAKDAKKATPKAKKAEAKAKKPKAKKSDSKAKSPKKDMKKDMKKADKKPKKVKAKVAKGAAKKGKVEKPDVAAATSMASLDESRRFAPSFDEDED